MKLNKEQEIVAGYEYGPALVKACPGSGKSTVASVLVANLVKKGINRILCLTFTNAAANSISQKIAKQLNLGENEKLPIFCGTFHRFCLSVLKAAKRNGYGPDLTIMNTDDQKSFIKKLVRKLTCKNQDDETECKIEFNMDVFVREINSSREDNETRKEMEERLNNRFDFDPLYVEVANEYLDLLPKMNCVDFTGMQSETAKIIDEHPDILEKLQNKFTHIICDESQDLNKIQFYVLNRLAEKNKNIMMIGDLSQSIYAFRGSKIENIQKFLDMYKDTVQEMPLSLNYRSTNIIVNHARQLIEHNKSHMKIDYKTDNPQGDPVVCQCFETQQEEAKGVAYAIKELIENGTSPDEIFVLYRINSMSIELQIALNNLGIPFVVRGGANYFGAAEIQACLSLMKFAVNQSDSISYHKASGFIDGVGDMTIGKLEEMATQVNQTPLQMASSISNGSVPVKSKKIYNFALKLKDIFNIDKSSASLALKTMVEGLDIESYLTKKYPKDFQKRIDNVKSLIENAAMYDSKQGKGLKPYLDNLMLASDAEEKDTEVKSVALMTAHCSKGLESKVVFVIGFNHNLLPHKMALDENPEFGLEEERRIAYVSISRPKENLYCTHVKKTFRRDNHGRLQEVKMKPSQFLYESGILKV